MRGGDPQLPRHAFRHGTACLCPWIKRNECLGQGTRCTGPSNVVGALPKTPQRGVCLGLLACLSFLEPGWTACRKSLVVQCRGRRGYIIVNTRAPNFTGCTSSQSRHVSRARMQQRQTPFHTPMHVRSSSRAHCCAGEGSLLHGWEGCCVLGGVLRRATECYGVT